MTGKRRKFEREMDEELRAHIAAETEENIRRGMGREEARRRALAEFGGVEAVKEEARAMRWGVWLETLVQDVRYGARMLRKSPGFTAVAVLTLALGIGANTAIFSVVYGVVLRPLPFPEPEQLVFVSQTSLAPKLLVGGKEAPPPPGGEPIPFAPPNFVDFKEQARSFAAFGAWADTTRNLTGGEPERVATAMVTSGFFDALGVRPMYGRTFTADDERLGSSQVVVLSHGVWQRRYGADPTIIGRDVPIGGEPHVVVGVMPAGFSFPEGREVWLPLVFSPDEMTQRNSHYLDVVARLTPGVSVSAAQAELETIARRLGEQYPDSNKDFSARAVPMAEQISGDVRPVLLLLLGAVGFVLLIACGNVAHLMVARGSAREREMAVRAALGAPRSRLLRQLLTESLLLGLLGGALGMVVAVWGVDLIRTMGPAALPRRGDIALDAGVLLYALGISLVTGLLFGLAPALGSTHTSLQTALKEGVRVAGRSPRRLPRVLVAGEVALALILLAGAGLLVRTLWGLVNTPPGFDAGNVLTADVFLPRAVYRQDSQRADFAARVLERIRALPGVESAGVTSNIPLSGSSSVYGFLLEGQEALTGNGIPFANFRAVTPDYLPTLRVPLVRGRLIEERDVAGAPEVVVINEALARRYFPGEDPIGRRIRVARGSEPAWRTIVGIVANIHHDGLHVTPLPEMYVPFAQQPVFFVRLAVRTAGDPAALARPVRETVWAVDPDQPVSNLRPLADVVGASIAERRFYGILLGAFAAVAMALAAVGIYGVLAWSVAARTHEIGVRVALGAGRAELFTMILRQGLTPVLAGIALGLAGAAALTRLLESQLYGVQPTDTPTFLSVAVLLLLVAQAACLVPARRAMRVDPIVALRHE